MPAKLTPAIIKKKAFAKAIVEGKTATQAYREQFPKAQANTCQVEGSKFLSNPMVQAEIYERVADSTPEKVIAKIHRIADTAPLPETQLKALIALGNTRQVNLFKDNTPSITNNTLNVFDLDELRRRLSESTAYPQPDQLT